MTDTALKILVVHTRYRSDAPSGEDSVVERELALLKKHGFNVCELIVSNDDIHIRNLGEKVKVALNCIWSKQSKALLSSILDDEQPDIVHVHNTFPQLSLSIVEACNDKHVPIVQSLHNFRYICPNALLMRNGSPCELCISGNTPSVRPALKHKCYRDSTVATLPIAASIVWNRVKGTHRGKISRYIALTEFAKTKFIQAGFKDSLISIKPNFIDDPGQSAEDHNFALFAGRLTEEKGPDLLIEAWKNMGNFKLVVAGDGSLRKTLEAEVRREGLNVEFTGLLARKDILQYLKRASFLVVPSRCYEGFPAIIAESYACGTPVIAPNHGSLSEIVDDRGTGLLYSNEDITDLQRAIKTLIGDSSLRQELALNARTKFEHQYTDSINIQQLSTIYQTTIENYLAAGH